MNQTNVLKPGLVIDPVKELGHWLDRTTIDRVYIKIFMTKNYIMNGILIKKILSFFFSILSSYIKKIIFTDASLQVNS